MKKIVTLLLATMLLNGVALPGVKASKLEAATEKKTLRLYNWEDYIYEPESEEEEASILDQFKAFYEEKHPGVELEIIYDTFATNEDMYNIMKLGKSAYDLIAPSDYMIQKMALEGMLEKYEYDKATQTYPAIPNYNTYGSKYLKDIYDEIEVSEYAVGYMWGTLGIVYNPNLPDGTLDEEMMEDVKSWSILWDEKYKGKISIKDSMRDAYVVGLLYVHQDDLIALQAELASGQITEAEFKTRMAAYLNDTAPETVEKVSKALKELKKNIYGLEVDSGKNDIVTGKITMNTAWSGDAVYAMDIAESEEGVELYYSIPKEGANIWFDGWVMPKGADKDLAAEFLDFISKPSIAALNMEYIGYTSFIAGQEVLSLIHEWYDAEEGGTPVDLSYFFEGTVIEDLEDPSTSMIITSDLLGRQLTAQYPSEEEILRCVIMEHFDNETNNRIVEMWADFKATTIAPWMIVLIVLLALGVIGYLLFEVNRRKKSKRHARKAAKAK